jgi:hypothetical protein
VKSVGDRWWAAVVAVMEVLTRLIPIDFSLAIYTTFSHPDPSLKPYDYYTCSIIKQTLSVLTQPYTTALTDFRNDLRDFQA